MYVSYFWLSYQKVFSQLDHGLAFSTLCSQFGVLRLNFLPFQIVSGGACPIGIKQHKSHISGVTYFYKLKCMWDYIQEMRMLELLLDARFWISFGSHLKEERPSVMKEGLIRVY